MKVPYYVVVLRDSTEIIYLTDGLKSDLSTWRFGTCPMQAKKWKRWGTAKSWAGDYNLDVAEVIYEETYYEHNGNTYVDRVPIQ